MGKKILVVGCGGLGCELIKILTQDPDNVLTLIDDDTIDPTNLNRQFMFVSQDVGHSKAEAVARKISAIMTNPVKAYFSKIDEFPHLDFYRQFDIVFYCLDNNETRSFVNQRCYAANIVMIDGGSAGWLGQSFINEKECFDCLPRVEERRFPICSVRQRPKSFEHCLVRAKTVVNDINIESISEEIKEHGDSSYEYKDNIISSELQDDEVSNDIEICKNENETDDKELSAVNANTSTSENRLKKLKVIEVSNLMIDKFIDRINSQENRLQIIYDLAKIKAFRFGIASLSFIDSQTFIKNIIPSICTTNSIVASLMIIASHTKYNYFLSQGSKNILKVSLINKNTKCLTCSVPTYQCDFEEKLPISKFLENFKASYLIVHNTIYNQDSTVELELLDGSFGIAYKK